MSIKVSYSIKISDQNNSFYSIYAYLGVLGNKVYYIFVGSGRILIRTVIYASKCICDTTILVSKIDICMVNYIKTPVKKNNYTLLVRRRLQVLAIGESTLTRELGTPILYLYIMCTI